MPMQKTPPAANPDAYVRALDGWQRGIVEELRAGVRAAGQWDEAIKWGHLVYACGGPMCLIRAEAQRVLFGFWRGQRLRGLEPRLKPGGKYEMATLELREGQRCPSAEARRLVEAAAALNRELGDPTAVAKRG